MIHIEKKREKMFQILVPAGGRTQEKQEKISLPKFTSSVAMVNDASIQASLYIFAIALQKIPKPYF